MNKILCHVCQSERIVSVEKDAALRELSILPRVDPEPICVYCTNAIVISAHERLELRTKRIQQHKPCEKCAAEMYGHNRCPKCGWPGQ